MKTVVNSHSVSMSCHVSLVCLIAVNDKHWLSSLLSSSCSIHVAHKQFTPIDSCPLTLKNLFFESADGRISTVHCPVFKNWLSSSSILPVARSHHDRSLVTIESELYRSVHQLQRLTVVISRDYLHSAVDTLCCVECTIDLAMQLTCRRQCLPVYVSNIFGWAVDTSIRRKNPFFHCLNEKLVCDTSTRRRDDDQPSPIISVYRHLAQTSSCIVAVLVRSIMLQCRTRTLRVLIKLKLEGRVS